MSGSHNRKKIFLAVLAGLVAGFSLMVVLNSLYVKSSSNESCMACHSHPDSDASWKQSVHYNNGSGTVTDCADCHLPPEGSVRHFMAKAKTVRVLPTLRSLAEAQERFYLANGYYATDIASLDVDVADEYLQDGLGVKWKITNDEGISAAYNYRVDMPPVGYYFQYGTSPHPIHGKFYCNGYDSDIKTWVCQSLGEPVYSWTPHFTYW